MTDPARPAVSKAQASLGLAVAVRPGDGLGFRLAGAPVEEVPPGAETAAFRRLVSDTSVGVGFYSGAAGAPSGGRRPGDSDIDPFAPRRSAARSRSAPECRRCDAGRRHRVSIYA